MAKIILLVRKILKLKKLLKFNLWIYCFVKFTEFIVLLNLQNLFYFLKMNFI